MLFFDLFPAAGGVGKVAIALVKERIFGLFTCMIETFDSQNEVRVLLRSPNSALSLWYLWKTFPVITAKVMGSRTLVEV